MFRVGGSLDMSSTEGDPSMAILAPSPEYESTIALTASATFNNYVDIVAPVGALVTLDGFSVTGLTPIGSSGYSVAQRAVAPGFHSLSSTSTVNATLHGSEEFVSYMTVAGM